ncbi:hypothetical protein AVEN_167098-1 [Araneus ventricosus]|uniref:Endonuclease/exonuclease/phosphatase domain-containing protein n=1 Tax=Araneus ventricosus TaxID=182803 RepID=A0A4Y2LI39_ARAVE|nr:hypothetical protein AVEN_167098-1 [Araneus ventricosus]
MGGITALLIKNSIHHHFTPIPTCTFEITTTSIDLPNNKSFTISSIYSPPPHGKSNTQDMNNLFNLTPKGIAAGNFNSKYPAWSEGRANINGTIIYNHIANNNLVVLAPLELTHFSYHHLSNNTLDIGIMKNFSVGYATSVNDLSSVGFSFDIHKTSSKTKQAFIRTLKHIYYIPYLRAS